MRRKTIEKEKKNMFTNLILYGAGRRTKRLIKILEFCGLPIDIILDSNSEKWGTYIENYRVESPDVLANKTDYILCITVANSEIIREIRTTLQNDYLFDLSNEITYEELVVKAYERTSFDKLGILDSPAISKRKAIIFDCENGLVLGGIEEWTKGLCSEFIKKDEFDAYILSNFGDYDVPKELENHMLRVDIKAEDSFLPSNILKIAKCISQYVPCVLVTSQPNEVLLAGKILKLHYKEDIQIISGIRGGSEEIYKSYINMKSCTDLYVCVSSDIQKNMIQRGIDKNKALVMICPIECPNSLERTYTTNKNEAIRIGYAGRIVIEQKRMDLLLELVCELEKNNVNYYMELAGDGDFKPLMMGFISENRLENKIKLVGILDKEGISKFWADKDICINIADYEGRSRSIAEAMANGAVPVVTRTSGVNDDIVDNDNGFIVDIGDYVTMAERIQYLDEHRMLLEKMGYKAHIEIKQKSSMEEHYRFWKEIIS